MAKTKAAAAQQPHPVVAPESPLVPNAKMRRMYERMVENRLLAEACGSRRGVREIGQEAGRVAALIDLQPEDWISDMGVPSAFLGRPRPRPTQAESGASSQQRLPEVERTAERFALALGAAIAFKRLNLPHVVVVFAEAGEAKWSAWHPPLALAARMELPVFFVVLPIAGLAKAPAPFKLSARATAAGVPGIPVEGTDAVALYRVAQESLHRARAGGGPALMECVRFVVDGARKTKPIDPLEAMAATLLARGICDQKWLTGVAAAFRKRRIAR